MLTTLSLFQTAIESLANGEGPHYTKGSVNSIVLPAKSVAIGDLTIYDDGDELTVEIGDKHHTHFSAYNYEGESEEARLLAAVQDAARFVADVLADRVYVSVDYRDGDCIGSSCGYVGVDPQVIGHVRPPDESLDSNSCDNMAIKSDYFLWSGPREAPNLN